MATEAAPSTTQSSTAPKVNPLRLKKNASSNTTDTDRGQHRRHHHRHHHRHRRRRSASPRDRDSEKDPFARSLSPETAFRESLFDALADDEGAAFWEGVYGQPVHIYSRHYRRDRSDDGDTTKGRAEDGEEGNDLETMTDEEYASYVRSRMYERSHEYIFAERDRRAQDRQRQREREREQQKQRYRHDEREAGDEEAWHRGGAHRRREPYIDIELAREEEEQRRQWTRIWRRYNERWSSSVTHGSIPGDTTKSQNQDQNDSKIPAWPTPTLSLPPNSNPTPSTKEIPPKNQPTISKPTDPISEFYASIKKHIFPSQSTSTSKSPPPPPHTTTTNSQAYKTFLKRERIRWHPDKFSRLISPEPSPAQAQEGESKSKISITQTVTHIFQIVDRLWKEEEEEEKKISP